MRRRAALLALALTGASCGYALLGRGVTTAPSIRRIGVPLFRDATGRAGLDQKVTQRVIEELLKRGRFDVVQESTGVDALVEGELLSYMSVPVGFSGGEAGQPGAQANRYSATLIARVRYAKTGQTEPLWENDAFTYRDEYDVSEDPSDFFNQEEQAIDRLLRRDLLAHLRERGAVQAAPSYRK